MRRAAVVGMLVAGLLVGACRSKEEPLGPTATLPQPTTTIDPYAVPPVIDEAYVNRVLAGLDQAVGDVTRLVVASRTIPPEAVDRLRSIYRDDDLLQLVVDTYQNDLFRELEGIRSAPGNRNTRVIDLLAVRSDCIFAKVAMDASQVAISPQSPVQLWVGLVPFADPQGLNTYNVTHWGLIVEGFSRDLSAPRDPCDAS